MKKKIAFLFPGQGAQIVGMGRDFATSFSRARETFQEADSLLNRSLSDLIFSGPLEKLTETQNSQSAIFVTSMALLRVVEQQFPELSCSVSAGLSLGEYTALTASRKLSFAETLFLVEERGKWMNRACEEIRGTMAAIFGMTAEEVLAMVADLGLTRDLWAANFNAPGQTVISGTLKGIELGTLEAKKRGAKRIIPLKVHGAFHSGLMGMAKEKLTPHIESVNLAETPVTLVMNVPGTPVVEAKKIKENMILQVTHPVRWEQGIRAMEGIDLFIEIGPGKTLNGLNQKIGVVAPTISIGQASDLEDLAKVI